MPPPIRFVCRTCGKRLKVPADAAGRRAICPDCGQRTRAPGDPLDGRTRSQLAAFDAWLDGPTDATLGGVFRAAWADWKRSVPTLGPAVLLAEILWPAATAAALYGGALVLIVLTGAHGYAALVPFFFAACFAFVTSWAIACYVTHGLTGAHLVAARGSVRFGSLFRAPRFWRATLCLTLLGGFGAALFAAPVWLAGYFRLWAVHDALMGAIWLGSLLLVPPALFLLFWPVPFLIHDRPELRHVRPLLAAIKMGSGRWGGHVAVGAVAFLLTAGGPLAIAATSAGLIGLTGFGVGFGFGPPGVLGLLALSLPLLPFTAPLGGLMLAQAFDRAERARLGGD